MNNTTIIWSNDKPTTTGWYWLKDEQLNIICKIQVNFPDLLIDGYQWAKIEELNEEVNEEEV